MSATRLVCGVLWLGCGVEVLGVLLREQPSTRRRLIAGTLGLLFAFADAYAAWRLWP